MADDDIKFKEKQLQLLKGTDAQEIINEIKAKQERRCQINEEMAKVAQGTEGQVNARAQKLLVTLDKTVATMRGIDLAAC